MTSLMCSTWCDFALSAILVSESLHGSCPGSGLWLCVSHPCKPVYLAALSTLQRHRWPISGPVEVLPLPNCAFLIFLYRERPGTDRPGAFPLPRLVASAQLDAE